MDPLDFALKTYLDLSPISYLQRTHDARVYDINFDGETLMLASESWVSRNPLVGERYSPVFSRYRATFKQVDNLEITVFEGSRPTLQDFIQFEIRTLTIALPSVTIETDEHALRFTCKSFDVERCPPAPDTYVANAELLTKVFGDWPSFHDAEIVWIHLDRGGPAGPSLTAAFHLFRMTKDVDERGYFILKDHVLATLRFDNIVLQELKWFNHQNAIDGLEVGAGTERRFTVEFPSNWGCDAHFDCDQIEVVSVEPYEPRRGQSDGITLDGPKPV